MSHPVFKQVAAHFTHIQAHSRTSQQAQPTPTHRCTEQPITAAAAAAPAIATAAIAAVRAATVAVAAAATLTQAVAAGVYGGQQLLQVLGGAQV